MTKALVAEIVQRLEAVSTAERRKVAAHYHPTALRVLGASNPDATKVMRDVAQRVKKASAEEVLGLCEALVDDGTMEGRHVAYLLLGRHKAAFAGLTPAHLERLGSGNDNWASVDGFACTVTGKAWLQGLIDDALVERWARSQDRWWRRTGLVSTVPLNRIKKGAPGDTRRTLKICDMLVEDRDDMIVKAMSWALRGLIEHDRAAVERYLLDNSMKLHSRVLREVRRKLDTGRKYPKRKS